MHERALRRMRILVRIGRYVMTIHGQEEMEADELVLSDIEHTILKGRIVERQKDRRTGEWKHLVEGRGLSGRRIVVVGKVGAAGKLVIITVYELR